MKPEEAGKRSREKQTDRQKATQRARKKERERGRIRKGKDETKSFSIVQFQLQLQFQLQKHECVQKNDLQLSIIISNYHYTQNNIMIKFPYFFRFCFCSVLVTKPTIKTLKILLNWFLCQINHCHLLFAPYTQIFCDCSKIKENLVIHKSQKKLIRLISDLA